MPFHEMKAFDLRPIRFALVIQLVLTAVAMLAFGAIFGEKGLVSALLGGGVNIVANLLYGVMIRIFPRPMTPGKTLSLMLRAEAVKIAAIAVLLIGVFVLYPKIQAAAFFAAFILTALAFGAAFLSQDKKPASRG
jgi:F0F1-type ATP synthase assembly protein I